MRGQGAEHEDINRAIGSKHAWDRFLAGVEKCLNSSIAEAVVTFGEDLVFPIFNKSM